MQNSRVHWKTASNIRGTSSSISALYLAIELVSGLDPDVLALSEVEYGLGELDGAALPLQLEVLLCEKAALDVEAKEAVIGE